MPSRSSGSARLAEQKLGEQRLVVIANPTAGVSAGRVDRLRLVERAVRELERHGLEVDVQTDEDPASVSDRAEQAVRDGYRRVIAAGGDGTVNAVVNGMMRCARGNPLQLREVALGVLPIGTGNVFAF